MRKQSKCSVTQHYITNRCIKSANCQGKIPNCKSSFDPSLRSKLFMVHKECYVVLCTMRGAQAVKAPIRNNTLQLRLTQEVVNVRRNTP